MRWWIAEKTGWTLDYIDSLSPEDLWEWQSVKDAENKVAEVRAMQARVRASLRR